MQPALGIDGLRSFFLDLRQMLRAEVRAREVAHHDVAATEAQLTHELLLGAVCIRSLRQLLLLVEVRRIALERFHLLTHELGAAGAPLVHLLGRHGARAAALGHAVELVDGQAQGTEVLEGVHPDGRRTCEAVLTLVQAELGLDLAKDFARQSVVPRHGARAAQLHVQRVLEREPLGPGADLLLSGRGLRGDGADLVRDLLPDQGHTQEDRRLCYLQAVLDGLLLQVIGSREEASYPPGLLSGADDGCDDVHHHACHVRQRQVREDAFLGGRGAELARVAEGLEDGGRLVDDVVVRDHDSLGVAGSPRGVDEPRAVARLDGLRALLQDLDAALLLALLEQARPTQNRHYQIPDSYGLPVGGNEAVCHEGLQVLAIATRRQSLGQAIHLRLVLNDDNSALRVNHLESSCLGVVSGVETRALATGEHRGDSRHVPLRRVEAPDVHGLERPEAQSHEASSCQLDLIVVGLPSPGRPLGPRQGGRHRPALGHVHIPLDEHRVLGSLDLRRLLQQRHERRWWGVRAPGPGLGQPGRHLTGRVAGEPWLGRAVVEEVVLRLREGRSCRSLGVPHGSATQSN
mmetsp:Transcript_116088/g.369358  ORF Transcript_116088/g.369358 Transcript_116088/m.369358 type:complete len:575 (+) Transcript_116088:863-2587(+)